MIIEDKRKIDELLPYLPLRLARALAWLRDADFAVLPDGRREIEGKDIYVNIMSYKTGKREEQKAEAHYKYIDVQYVIKGQEFVYHAPTGGENQTVAEKNSKEDYVFFAALGDAKEYRLTAGSIAIFFPWDIHQAKCCVGGHAANVRKAVIKVRAEG
jgi:YhcH/YjgK/YiaL family protein